jgi:CIC family chloride channel protein
MRPPPRLPTLLDEGMRQTGPLILYSAFTGALAGLLVALLNLALKALSAFFGAFMGYLPPEAPGEGGLLPAFTGPPSPLLALLLPLLFALTSFLGTGQGLFALLLAAREGRPPRRGAYPRSVLGSALQIAFYSPMGREGPFGVLGLWLGSALDRRFPRVGGGLAFAGLAAGLGAALHAPVAGALLATEILYRSLSRDPGPDPGSHRSPLGLRRLRGFLRLRAPPPLPGGVDLAAVPWGGVVGLLAAALATLWTEGGRLLEGYLKRLAFPLRHALLGLALALALLLLPEALGHGLGWVAVAATPLLATWALFYLLLSKLLLLLLAQGVRAYGGPYTPALVLGGLLGALLARLPGPLALPPEALALAGGAAVLSGVARAPFAATLLAAEWGGYATLPLVIPAVLLAYVLTPAHALEEARPEAPATPEGSPSETPPQTPPPPLAPEADDGRESPRG